MNNLQNFNQTLENFNQEVEQLKYVSSAYKKFQQLSETYDTIIKQFDDNNKTLEKINNLSVDQQVKVAEALSELENVAKQNKIEILKLLEEKTDLIRKENKDFYRELESTIKIKLDENKSQIKQIIEYERNQIKQIFEIEFAKNNKELGQVIEKEAEEQTKILADNQKTISISVWVFGGLVLLLSLLILIKQWI